MPFCTECGFKLPPNAVFCPNCGAATASEKSENAADNTIIEPNPAPKESGSYYEAPPAEHSSATELGYPRPGEKPRKPMSAGKIVLIVLAAALTLLILFLVLYFAFFSVNKASPPHINAPSQVETPTPTSPPNANVAGSGELGDGDFFVSVVGAQEFSDYEGKPAIRIYFDFTNNFDFAISAWDALDFSATQDGAPIKQTHTWDDSDVYYNYSYNIRPGVTIRCCYEFSFNPRGGTIDFSLFDLKDGENSGSVKASYIPDSLPGAPPPFEIAPVPNPTWTAKKGAAGYLDDQYYVTVTEGELITTYDGDPAVRIYYEFTNESKADICLNDALTATTYQDGIQLNLAYAPTDSETDLNFLNPVKPGEKITASRVFALRNESSPIEAELESRETYGSFGQTYAIN
ncbi:MAG: DUF5067 domain-containing protein [Oscillospiraceae bacterium]